MSDLTGLPRYARNDDGWAKLCSLQKLLNKMTKLFAHRGFVTESHPENSVASLKEAVAQGFNAIEFDLWYAARRLVLKHDQPKEEEAEILPDLEDYLVYKNDLTYWLDFKNIDDENCAKVLLLAKSEIESADVKLDQIYFAPFITDLQKAEKVFTRIRNIFGYKTKVVAVCESLKSEKDVQDLRDFLDRNNVKCLSIFHQLLSKNSMQILSGIEIFAWTVNDLQRIRDLESLGVTNFATDKITPQIYAGKITSRTS